MCKSTRVGLATDQVKDWCLVVGRAAFYMAVIGDFFRWSRVLSQTRESTVPCSVKTQNLKSVIADKHMNNNYIQFINL